MGKTLNIGSPKEYLDCLGCHSMATINPKVPLSAIKPDYLQQGVSCLSCHGAFKDWIPVHGSSIDGDRVCWRNLTREEKQKDWGMTDLWDPVHRTQVCASCHIGDADPEKHRFVTHAMYAAGHPPLPAFETAAFSNSMPRHWQLMNEKTPEMQAQDYRWNPKELEQTKLAVLGDAAAFRSAVNLLATKAKNTPEKEGLDFALFDCSACHHDLKQPSWRQTAGYEGPPGRPGVRRWSPADMDLSLWYAGGTPDGRKTLRDEFAAQMGDLRSAFTSRPYGDAGQVAKAGQSLVQWADEKLIAGLTKPDGAATRYDVKAALALLKQLATDAANPAPGKTPDFDGARQTAWTFRAIYDDASRALKESKDDPEAAKLGGALQDKEAAVKAELDKLDAALSLNLPNANAAEVYDKDPKGAAELRQHEIENYLPGMLKKTADYDPTTVQRAFAELAKLLP